MTVGVPDTDTSHDFREGGETHLEVPLVPFLQVNAVSAPNVIEKLNAVHELQINTHVKDLLHCEVSRLLTAAIYQHHVREHRERSYSRFPLIKVTGSLGAERAMPCTCPCSDTSNVRNLVAGLASECGGLMVMTRPVVRKLDKDVSNGVNTAQ